MVGIVDHARLGTADGGDWIRLALSAVMVGVLGWLLADRRPDHPLGWLLLAVAVLFGLSGFGDAWAVFALAARPGTPGGVWAAWVSERFTAVLSAGLPLTLLVLPDGHLLSRRWRAAVWYVIGAVVCLTVVGILDPQDLRPESQVPAASQLPNPTGIRSARAFLDALVGVSFTAYLAALIVAIVALVLRYRRGDAATRVQLRWVVLAVLAYVAISFAPAGAFPGPSMLPDLVATALLCAVLAAATLRYRLFDIDVIVNRALVYVALSVCVVGGYVAVVAGLGRLVQARSSLTVSLVATGVVAALFSPLRARLQRTVNRLTYGYRFEPGQALAHLSERMAMGSGGEDLLGAIAAAAAEVLRLPYAAVTAALDHGERRAASGAVPAAAVPLHHIALEFAGQPVGTLTVAPREGQRRLTAADLTLLDDLARQAAVAVRAIALSDELQRSRERIVIAREEERRRLRRDLHDGLAPTLAGIAIRADTAGRFVADEGTVVEALASIKLDAQTAIGDVRRIVADLRPVSLDQVGLVGALEREAARYAPALAVEVHAPDPLAELPAAVEVAVLRIVSEALHNAARHADATVASVVLAWSGAHELVVTISDHGRGLAGGGGNDGGGGDGGLVDYGGVGLASMRERATELHGRLAVETRADGGTVVQAVIPVAGERADALAATAGAR